MEKDTIIDNKVSVSSLFKNTLFAIGGLVVIFILLLQIVSPTQVSGNSMSPLILNGDNLLVDKFLYGLAIPKRGDIIIFRKQNGGDSIGRIIGLPGEDVSIKTKTILVNGQELGEGYINWDQWKDEWDSDFHLIDNYLILNDMRTIRGIEITGSDIIGKVFYRYLPLNRAGKIKK